MNLTIFWNNIENETKIVNNCWKWNIPKTNHRNKLENETKIFGTNMKMELISKISTRPQIRFVVVAFYLMNFISSITYDIIHSSGSLSAIIIHWKWKKVVNLAGNLFVKALHYKMWLADGNFFHFSLLRVWDMVRNIIFHSFQPIHRERVAYDNHHWVGLSLSCWCFAALTYEHKNDGWEVWKMGKKRAFIFKED